MAGFEEHGHLVADVAELLVGQLGAVDPQCAVVPAEQRDGEGIQRFHLPLGQAAEPCEVVAAHVLLTQDDLEQAILRREPALVHLDHRLVDPGSHVASSELLDRTPDVEHIPRVGPGILFAFGVLRMVTADGEHDVPRIAGNRLAQDRRADADVLLGVKQLLDVLDPVPVPLVVDLHDADVRQVVLADVSVQQLAGGLVAGGEYRAAGRVSQGEGVRCNHALAGGRLRLPERQGEEEEGVGLARCRPCHPFPHRPLQSELRRMHKGRDKPSQEKHGSVQRFIPPAALSP